MTPTSRLTAVALVAAGLSACASPSTGGERAEAVPGEFAGADAPIAPDAPAVAARGGSFDLLAAMAAVTDRARGSDGAAVPAEPAAKTSAASGCRFSFAPYVWLFDMEGTVTAKNGRDLPISTTLHDSYDLVKDHIEPSFAGHFEGTDGVLTFFVDGNYLHFESESDGTFAGPLGLTSIDAELDVDLKLAQAELGGTYLVAEFRANAQRPARIEVLAGARWNSVELDADLEIDGLRVSRDAEAHFRSSWVDPFVGARTRIPVCEAVDFSLRGDVGGGMGEGCQNVWNVVTGIDWRLSESTSLFAGYRWYDMDRRSGGRDTSMQFEGPGVGVIIVF